MCIADRELRISNVELAKKEGIWGKMWLILVVFGVNLLFLRDFAFNRDEFRDCVFFYFQGKVS
jgi:hypothetical protein